MSKRIHTILVVTQKESRDLVRHKKPKDLSVFDREERERGEGGGVYVV